MATAIQIRGAEQLRAMSRAFRAAANGKEIRKETVKALRAAVRPVVDEQRATVRSLRHAPSEWRSAAARATRIQVRTTGQRAGVRIVVASGDTGRQAKHLNKGHWRHPTFGHAPWKTQNVQPDWFDRPAEHHRDQVQKDVFEAIGAALRRLLVAGIRSK